MAALLGSGKRKGSTGGHWSNKLWMAACVGMLALAMLVPFAGAEEPAEQHEEPKFTLTLTDNGEGLLFWVESISLFAYDPVSETRSNDPAVQIDAPSDPAKCLLPGGHYEVLVMVTSPWGDTVEMSLGTVEISEDTVFDIVPPSPDDSEPAEPRQPSESGGRAC